MQYKIPVQIENEDPIFLGLSLRQLAIVMIGSAIAYYVFKSLSLRTSSEIALIPSIFIILFTLVIALFKNSEMTFVPFILALLRFNINPKERIWANTIDSFQPIDIGILTNIDNKKDEKVDFDEKIDKMKEFSENIEKI
ncbi:PrgI family protein [Candidatus Gracilibacteria bacterium]|nr:PrgI family protein [Candidatus Gracilibacteria bacterium]NUJ98611.1 PrgI family protein [Candidatus Gracilibacteria bacterium]